eukprot:SAG11_NODE_1879_length_4130_cov_3.133466_1_plen_76_part_10
MQVFSAFGADDDDSDGGGAAAAAAEAAGEPPSDAWIELGSSEDEGEADFLDEPPSHLDPDASDAYYSHGRNLQETP